MAKKDDSSPKSVKMPDGLVKISLRCTFTHDELLEQAKLLAEANRQKQRLEDDKKNIVAEYTSRIASKTLDVAVFSEKVTNGYEHRDVECRVVYDVPKAGMKTIYRNDTGEKVDERQMNDEERQLKLSLLNEAQGDGANSKTIPFNPAST